MTVLAVLTVPAVLESSLPSCCLSCKIQYQEATVTVVTALVVSAVVVVSVVTATPLNSTPPFRHPEIDPSPSHSGEITVRQRHRFDLRSQPPFTGVLRALGPEHSCKWKLGSQVLTTPNILTMSPLRRRPFAGRSGMMLGRCHTAARAATFLPSARPFAWASLHNHGHRLCEPCLQGHDLAKVSEGHCQIPWRRCQAHQHASLESHHL